ncbi:hypothetical protein HGRIS_010492 [Hohenbuehelia grisea]|uniref:Uncharacterized protein n=1 Tax=Hohenbuehelia grisea TaxID=104357 RepID=A0ABR3IZ95_9AGAR
MRGSEDGPAISTPLYAQKRPAVGIIQKGWLARKKESLLSAAQLSSTWRNLRRTGKMPASDTTLFLGINGNFRLKRKIVSNEENDPSLSKGWAYIVEEKAFKVHITGSTHEVETSTCSSYKAISEAKPRQDHWLSLHRASYRRCIARDFKRAMSVRGYPQRRKLHQH